MTNQEIKELAGHREVPPWVMKLVADAVAMEREQITQMCDSALEATKEAKKQLRADEIFAHSVASGAIHQAERLTKAIRARGEE